MSYITSSTGPKYLRTRQVDGAPVNPTISAGPFSVVVWYKRDSVSDSASYGVIDLSAQHDDVQNHVNIIARNNVSTYGMRSKLELASYNQVGEVYETALGPDTTSDWTLAVAVCNSSGSNTTFESITGYYWNASLGAASTSTVKDSTNAASTRVLGSELDNLFVGTSLTLGVLNGKVAELAIFNKALSKADVVELATKYANATSFSANCTHYWPLYDSTTASVGGPNLSAIGSPSTSTDHPALSAGASVAPVVMSNFMRMRNA